MTDSGSDNDQVSDERSPRPDPLALETEPIPEMLRDHDHWVCWRYEWDADRDEWTKVPIDATTKRYAKATDPDTWVSFATALDFHDRPDTDTDGLGFVLDGDDDIVGLDLDECRDPMTGDLVDWARDALGDVPTYAEVSPSGTGLRLFGRGSLPDGRTRADINDADGHLEMYEDVRYLTVTGHRLDDAPADIEPVNDEIREVHAAYIASGTEVRNTATEPVGGGHTDSGAASPKVATDETHLDDDELIERATNAENGEKFQRLWNGDTSAYPSHSEADCALCCLLGFWTGGDREQMDRLFRRSGLYREKWERDDYRERTMDKALSGLTEFYDPASTTDGRARPPDAETARMNVALCPADVIAAAGFGEDADVADLTDREKAACVWDLIRESDAYHVRVRRDNGSLWAYDNGVWTQEGERTLRHAARVCLGAMNYGNNVLTELEAQVRSDPTVEVEPDDFGLTTGTLAVENGLVDLDAAAAGAGNDALRPLRPDDLALTRLPMEFDPEANADEWAAYVEEWAEDGRADALQEYVGYCLHIGALPIHRALLLVGSGANGKGTFLHVVRSLLGRENTTSVELQTLANEPDAVADFYGALANIDDDLSARKLGSGLGMFKKLVGGDRVRARRLYEDGFEFDATGKHLYAANEVPEVKVSDEDEAFWRRWLLIEFPNHYPPSARDPNLRDRLTDPDALAGVLNWAIEGRRRLLDQGQFTNEEHYAQQKRERWQKWGDSVETFIAECVEHDPDADRRSTSDAYQVYVAWCSENGEEPVGQQKFTNTLKNEDVGYKKLRVPPSGTSTLGYDALGFTEAVPEPEDTGEKQDDGTTQQQRLG